MILEFNSRLDSPPVGQGLLIVGASRSHSDTSHSVGLLWTSDHHRHPWNRAGFEPAIPVSERCQTQALHRAATGIGVAGESVGFIFITVVLLTLDLSF